MCPGGTVRWHRPREFGWARGRSGRGSGYRCRGAVDAPDGCSGDQRLIRFECNAFVLPGSNAANHAGPGAKTPRSRATAGRPRGRIPGLGQGRRWALRRGGAIRNRRKPSGGVEARQVRFGYSRGVGRWGTSKMASAATAPANQPAAAADSAGSGNAGPPVWAASAMASATPSGSVAASSAPVVPDFIRFFIGDGTATNWLRGCWSRWLCHDVHRKHVAYDTRGRFLSVMVVAAGMEVRAARSGLFGNGGNGGAGSRRSRALVVSAAVALARRRRRGSCLRWG